MPKPPNCPDAVYELMLACWAEEPSDRPSWLQIYKQLTRFEKKRKKAKGAAPPTTKTTQTKADREDEREEEKGSSCGSSCASDDGDAVLEFERAAELYSALPAEMN